MPIDEVMGLMLGVPGARGGASFVTLPQYLETNTGTVLATYDSLTNIATFSGAAALDEVNYFTGSASVKLTNNASTSSGQLHLQNQSISIPGGPARFRAYFYVYDTTKLTSIQFTLWAGGSKRTYCRVLNGGIFGNGWNCVEIYLSQWTPLSGFLWSDTITQITFTIETPDTSTQTSVSLDKIVIDMENSPSVFISFDDNLSSVYSVARPIMAAHNIRGTVYCITSTVGDAGKMSAAQMAELYEAGWDIANHTANHTNLREATVEDGVTDLEAAKTYLDALGFTRSSAHVAYPFGASTGNAREAMITAGMLSGRITNQKENYFPLIVAETGASRLRLPALQLDNNLTLTEAKAYVDSAIANNYVLSFYGHDLGATATAYRWVTSDFEALIAYIAEKKLPCVTVSELHAARTGPIVVPATK